jgi:hypothetical protein
VTHDGADAENPTATRDGWIVYSGLLKRYAFDGGQKLNGRIKGELGLVPLFR